MTIERYSVFGLSLATERRLWLQPGSLPGSTELSLVEEPSLQRPAGLQLLHSLRDASAGPGLRVEREGTRLWLEDEDWLACFDPADPVICFRQRQPEAKTFELFVERVLAPLYQLEKHPSTLGVHGGAASFRGSAWVFVGAGGAGKSTTAYELLRQGALHLADDMALVDTAASVVLPGPPSMHLRRPPCSVPEAIAEGPLQRDKRWFRLPVERTGLHPVPLQGIVVLAPDPNAVAPSAHRLRGVAAATELLAQTFSFDFADPARSRRRFQLAAQLVRSVPVYRLRYRRSADGRPTHLEAVLALLGGSNDA